MIRYNILASGSSGNCTVIENEIMLDSGVPFAALRPYIRTLRLCLLTHRHADHFNEATIRALARERPSLRFVCGSWLYDDLRGCSVVKAQIDRMVPGESATYRAGDSRYVSGYTITMVPAVHSVPNAGYKLKFADGKRILYLTDTSDLSKITAINYDLYLLEQNHTEEDIQRRIDAKISSGEFSYEIYARESHLSVEKAKAWLDKNIGPNSVVIPMHKHQMVGDGRYDANMPWRNR